MSAGKHSNVGTVLFAAGFTVMMGAGCGAGIGEMSFCVDLGC